MAAMMMMMTEMTVDGAVAEVPVAWNAVPSA